VRADVPLLVGRDVSESALALVRKSVTRAGLGVRLALGALSDAEEPAAGAIVTNPPYGRRLERPAELARDLGRLVDRHPASYLAFLMAEEQPLGHTRRRPQAPRELFNGDIRCVLRSWAPLRVAE
jgi:23S rRNA G2445 N2-methylase RlmL